MTGSCARATRTVLPLAPSTSGGSTDGCDSAAWGRQGARRDFWGFHTEQSPPPARRAPWRFRSTYPQRGGNAALRSGERGVARGAPSSAGEGEGTGGRGEHAGCRKGNVPLRREAPRPGLRQGNRFPDDSFYGPAGTKDDPLPTTRRPRTQNRLRTEPADTQTS